MIGLSFKRPFAGSKFDPSKLTDLSVWYRGDSKVLNSTTVSQWTDKSGNGRHAVQATAINQPTYNATDASFNNQPTATMANGGNQAWLKFDAATYPSIWLPQPATIYCVFNITSAASSGGDIVLDGIESTGRMLISTYPNNSNFTSFAGGALIQQTSPIPALNTSYAVAFVYDHTGAAKTTVYISAKTACSITTDSGADGIFGITVGAEQAQTGGYNHNGKVAEVIYCNTAHSPTTVAKVLNYLGARYAITIGP